MDDAIIAVQMVDASMSNSSILGTGNTPMAEFPSDAEDAMEVLRSRIKKTKTLTAMTKRKKTGTVGTVKPAMPVRAVRVVVGKLRMPQ